MEAIVVFVTVGVTPSKSIRGNASPKSELLIPTCAVVPLPS